MKVSLLLSLVLGLYFPTVFAQSNMTNEMFDLAKLKSGVKNKRISSTDPTGGNRDHLEPFKPGEKRIIADIKGAGAINHIWVTIAPPPYKFGLTTYTKPYTKKRPLLTSGRFL